MKRVLRIPIRWKILVSVLFIVTAVVSVITFTMASLFHQDKRAYVSDLVSVVSSTTAEQCRSLLMGYAERSRVYGRIVSDEHLSQQEKNSLMKSLFGEFPELVAITVNDTDGEIATAHNAAALRDAGLSKEEVQTAYQEQFPDVDDLLDGDVLIRNTTLSAELPSMTLATVTGGEDPVLVVANIRLDALMRVAGNTNAFEISIAAADGTLLAHSDSSRVTRRDPAGFPTEITVMHEHSAVTTRESEHDGKGMTNAYARTGVDGIIVAAGIPSSVAFLASRELLRRLLMVGLVLMLLAAVVGLVWAYTITRPIVRLSEATEEVAKGRFHIQVAVKGRDEMGTLASSFNKMAFELDSRETKLEQANAQLIQSEKLAAFGQLGAGIAHEVKNPLAGILGCAQLSLRKRELDPSVHENLILIEKETKRCKSIIENLLKFARQEPTELRATDVNSVVEDATAIVNHQIELQKVKLRKELTPGLPTVSGNANQLQQVLMNLMINAQQAMEGNPGTVTVSTRLSATGGVEISICDDGPGMTDEVKRRLFEPFFTTKPGGKGTGLGLSVSFGIIQDHAGEILVESTPGNGTTFTIRIPAVAGVEDPVDTVRELTSV